MLLFTIGRMVVDIVRLGHSMSISSQVTLGAEHFGRQEAALDRSRFSSGCEDNYL